MKSVDSTGGGQVPQKRVGILTFHWAANHGAVLQTYASCSYLKARLHCDVSIIDYCPRHYEHTFLNAIRRIRPKAILQRLRDCRKEACVRDFRRRLPMSRRYYSNEELMSSLEDYDILLTGSDQIWNPSYLMHGERKVTPVYYLNFGGGSTKKLSLSASFGCVELPPACQEIVTPLLKRLSAISVRESSAVDIVRRMGIDAVTLTADPTALLSPQEYLELCSPVSPVEKGSVSKMILRRQSRENEQLIAAVCSRFSTDDACDIEFCSIPDWLAAIRDSRMVVTNSFHCAMMCLKLHTEFYVILEDNAMSGMNDRFFTLLERLGLRERIITDVSQLEKVSPINFAEVDRDMDTYAGTLREYLAANI